jgi:hypothetical protein
VELELVEVKQEQMGLVEVNLVMHEIGEQKQKKPVVNHFLLDDHSHQI